MGEKGSACSACLQQVGRTFVLPQYGYIVINNTASFCSIQVNLSYSQATQFQEGGLYEMWIRGRLSRVLAEWVPFRGS